MHLIRLCDRRLLLFCAIVRIVATLMMPDYTNRDISEEHA
jgi:hypothetical protein